jgi:hypothetical protein
MTSSSNAGDELDDTVLANDLYPTELQLTYASREYASWAGGWQHNKRTAHVLAQRLDNLAQGDVITPKLTKEFWKACERSIFAEQYRMELKRYFKRGYLGFSRSHAARA